MKPIGKLSVFYWTGGIVLTNLKQAKAFVSANKGEIFSLFILYLLFVLVAGLCYIVPFIGWILCILVSIYATTLLCYGITALTRKEKKSWSDLIGESFDTLFKRADTIGIAYLINVALLIPAMLIFFLITFGFIFSSIGVGASLSYGYSAANWTGFIFWFFLWMVAIVLLCFYAGTIQYRYIYKVMAAIQGKEPPLAGHLKDMIHMGCVTMLWCCVPFIGFIFAIIWELFYYSKICLDVTKEGKIPEKVEPYDGVKHVEKVEEPVQPEVKEEMVEEMKEETKEETTIETTIPPTVSSKEDIVEEKVEGMVGETPSTPVKEVSEAPKAERPNPIASLKGETKPKAE